MESLPPSPDTPTRVLCDIVTEDDTVIARGDRDGCHGNPGLIHRAVHVLVFNSRGHLLLQKRSTRKQVQPGRWDSSVGGHVEAGETYLEAARREMLEELGLKNIPITFLYPSKIRNSFESENVMTYLACFDGRVDFCREEIDEVRFWKAREITAALGKGVLTPNFEEEWSRWEEWNKGYHREEGKPVRFCGDDTFPDFFQKLPKEGDGPV